MSDSEGFFVESILGADTGKALVRVVYGGTDCMWEADTARMVALSLLDAASCAESDKAIFEYLTEAGQIPVAQVATMIVELRKFRNIG